MSATKVISKPQQHRISPLIRYLRLALVPVIILALSLIPRQSSTAQAGWQWYKTDTHTHSSISADGYVDLGILSQEAKEAGYNALFLTDHNLASEFPAHGIAYNRPFEDSYVKWIKGTYNVPNLTINELASTPVNTGTKSLHLVSSSTGSAETHLWGIRGPNFRSGEITLKFSVYPTQITAGSGAYVSVSIGGDARVTTSPAPTGGPIGYTTQANVISPGKSTILVWQLGAARTASTDPNARVITYPLPYTLNTWNHYTINVSNALLDIPVADRPMDHNGLTYIKMAAASNNGTVDAYFDSFLLKAASPVSPAQEFIFRNSIIGTYDTATFKIFPSIELGDGTHVNRFNFDISDPSQFVYYPEGINGILSTQQGGYPAQLNHPGSDGGVTDEEAIANLAYGADFMEVPRNQHSIDDWDAILNQGVQVIGSGSTDKHTGSYGASSNSTYIYAPALEFNALMRSFFEGRAYMASGLAGKVSFNLESGLQEPYPARYPVYVPSTLSAINVHLGIPTGISATRRVDWIRNDTPFVTDNVSGTSYDVMKSIPLDGASTYVRAEIRVIATEILHAMTQPILFKDVPNLPADKRFYVNGITTPNGTGYTRITTKGITATSWNTGNQTLSITLENATGSMVDLRMYSNTAPQQIQVNGAIISPVNSLTAFETATGSTWYYTGGLLYLKVKHASGTANVAVNFSGTPPSTPTFTSTATKTATPTVTRTPTRTPTATQPSGTVGVNVWVGASQPGNHPLGHNQALRVDYPGLNNGPVKMVGSQSLVGSEAMVYQWSGVNTSYTEIMGVPANQLDNIYWLPWYNNVDLDTQLRFANVSSSQASVRVFIGGVEMPGGPFVLTPGASTRKSFVGINAGPVEIRSNVNIVAAERVIYRANDKPTSFVEMMGLPNSQLNTTYWLPWYNNVDLDTQLRFGNVSSSTATVRVFIGGVEMPGGPFALGPGESMRKSFPGVNDGPVEIRSNVNIVAAERVIYKVNGVNTSFTEMMGLPNSQLNNTYWLPWYDNVDLDTQLRFANVSSSQATVRVYIGGVEMPGGPITLQPGESTRKSFAGVNTGPVKIVSNVSIVAAERVIYKVNGVNTSFSEMMGLPGSQLSTTYWLPWYNNVDLFSELHIGAP